MSEPLPRRRRRAKVTSRWPLRRWLTIATTVLVVVFVGAILAGTFAIAGLNSARTRLADDVDPGLNATLVFTRAMLDQETGVRGYALTSSQDALTPYRDGQTNEQTYAGRIMALIGTEPQISADLQRSRMLIAQWRTYYADPTIAQVAKAHGSATAAKVDPDAGKAQFDQVRAASDQLQQAAVNARNDARADLSGSATYLVVVCAIIAAVLLALFVLLAYTARAALTGPLARLAASVREVADGAFEREVRVSGPKEMVELADDVDWMRTTILAEVSAQQEINVALDATTADLRRSNAELEQFAYVASHDLQEPLRKVASFCQLLDRRYSGQLDERADQYIGFAVDGAKRMQILINDLLAFSRVGRHSHASEEVSCAKLIELALRNLEQVITETGATVRVAPEPPMPTVLGETALLTAVFQNLVSNAVKFRGDQPPVIDIDVRADDEDTWLFRVTDNGIGVEPEYAERVFVIFQRLHGKDQYPGTGIGLAMCRKIVEHHGGRIWLDTGMTGGTRVCFTLPALAPDTVHDTGTTDHTTTKPATTNSEVEAST